MSNVETPRIIEALVAAINDADTDAFVATFSDHGVVNDWGRVLSGHEGVLEWARTDAIGAGARMTLLSSSTKGNVTEISFDWKSRVFNGTSRAFVTIEDERVTEFRIPSH